MYSRVNNETLLKKPKTPNLYLILQMGLRVSHLQPFFHYLSLPGESHTTPLSFQFKVPHRPFKWRTYPELIGSIAGLRKKRYMRSQWGHLTKGKVVQCIEYTLSFKPLLQLQATIQQGLFLWQFFLRIPVHDQLHNTMEGRHDASRVSFSPPPLSARSFLAYKR